MYKILGNIFRKTNLFQCLRTAVSSFLYSTEGKTAGIRMVFTNISLKITEESVIFFSQLVLLSTVHRTR